MRIEVKAARYEALVIKVSKKLLLDQVIKAQEDAAKAAKVARELYEEFLKG